MKLSKMMIAVAGLAIGTTAFAAPNAAEIVRMSGASALKGNIAVSLNAMCSAAGGVMQEWIAGSNVSTYVCSTVGGLSSGTSGTYASAPSSSFVKFAGTDFSEVRLNVAGGSFTALQVAAGAGSDNYVNPGLGATVALGGAANAGVTGGVSSSSPDGIGGFSDVEYSGYGNNVKNSIPNLDTAISSLTTSTVGVAQAFGVAVSDALYSAMFTAQGLGNAPLSCLVTDTQRPECVPSIGKGQMASIMSNNASSAAKTQGAKFLAPQLPGNPELRYVRRVDTSGTQAAAQNYFLGVGNMTSPLVVIADPSNRVFGTAVATTGCNVGDIRPANPVSGGNPTGFSNAEVDTAFVANGQIDLCDRRVGTVFRVLAAPGTGDVRNELNKSTIQGGATNYAIGVMSAENDQATYRNTANVNTPTTWKWLRVQGAPVGQNAKPGAGNTNRNTLVSGDYDFFYETYAYTKPSTENDTFISALITQLSSGPALKGLATIGTAADQTPYSRGGRTDTPSAR